MNVESKEAEEDSKSNEFDQWKTQYEKRDLNDQAQCIIAGDKDNGALYLSSLSVAHNEQDLKQLGIEYVLTITHDKSLSDDVPSIHKNRKLHLSINDKVDVETAAAVNKEFPVACEWVQHKLIKIKKNVLVHCSSGISRSSSFIIFYLMSVHKMNLKQSFRDVFRG